tara:strand:+ start:19140 stop:20318 length:1179 start_codon:yes stop_codon:yes gene_type:complete
MSHFNVKTPRFYPVQNLYIDKRYDLGSYGIIEIDGGSSIVSIDDTARELGMFNPWKPKNIIQELYTLSNATKLCFVYASGQHTQITYQPSTVSSIGLNYFGVLGHNFTDSKAKIRLLGVDKSTTPWTEFELTEYTPLFNCSVDVDTSGKKYIVPTRYQDQFDEEDPDTANGTLMFEINPDEIDPGYGRYVKIEIVPFDGDHFEQDVQIGSFAWGRYYDMPHSPDLNYKMSVEYDNVTTQRTLGGADISNVRYLHKPGFSDRYEGFGREDLQTTGASRKSWSLNFSSLKSEWENSWDDEKGYLFPSSRYSNTEWRYGNDLFSRVLNITMGGQLPFIFEVDNSVKDEDTTVTFWGAGEHNEANFYIAKFASNNFNFEHTSHKMFNISMDIVESW